MNTAIVVSLCRPRRGLSINNQLKVPCKGSKYLFYQWASRAPFVSQVSSTVFVSWLMSEYCTKAWGMLRVGLRLCIVQDLMRLLGMCVGLLITYDLTDASWYCCVTWDTHDYAQLLSRVPHLFPVFVCLHLCVCVWESERETERDRERQLLSETWGERAESRVNKSLCLIFFFFLCCLWWFLHIFSTLQSQHLVSFGFRLNLLQETTTPSLPPSLSSHLLQSFIHTSALICVLF